MAPVGSWFRSHEFCQLANLLFAIVKTFFLLLRKHHTSCSYSNLFNQLCSGRTGRTVTSLAEALRREFREQPTRSKTLWIQYHGQLEADIAELIDQFKTLVRVEARQQI